MKTGTTTIQSVLGAAESKLFELGYRFLETGRIIRNNGNEKRKITNHLVGFRIGRTSKYSKKVGVFKELYDELVCNGVDNAILSTEVVSNFKYSREKLELLNSYFRSCGYNVRIIFYVRPQYKLISSFYVQLVKTRSIAVEFDAYVSDILNNHVGSRYDYYGYLEPWRDVFGDALDVRPMFGANFNLIDDFFSAIEIDSRALLQPEEIESLPSNQSLGPKTVEALRLANAVTNALGVDPKESREFCKQVRHYAADRHWDDVSFCGVDGAMAKEIQDRFHEQNERLSQQYWGVTWKEIFNLREFEAVQCNLVHFREFERTELDDLLSFILEAGKTNDGRTVELEEWRNASRV